MRACDELSPIDLQRIAGMNLEPPRISDCYVVERRQASVIAFNRNDLFRSFHQQRACQAAGAWADLDDGAFGDIACGARDLACQIEVEKKILPERFFRRQSVALDHIAERRKAVRSRHGSHDTFARARRALMSAASFSAAM